MPSEREINQIDKGWTKIMVIWVAMLSSLVFYLVICMVVKNQIQTFMEGPSLQVLKYALFCVSMLTLAGAYFFRKLLLQKITGPVKGPGVASYTIHSAVAKYLTVIIIVMALSESIGIYGMVLFLLSKDAVSLYQLMILAAIAMIFFRPKKEEFIEVANKMAL